MLKVRVAKLKSHVKGPNLRAPHLALPPELGSEDCHTIPHRRLRSRL